MADNPQEFDFPIGKVVGRKGDTGNGISSIELLETVGLSKTYRITMTDETYFDFTVTDGNGISGVSFNSETYTLTLTFDDGTSFTTGSLRGAPGQKGDDGYSPAITITTITGGHRVTITDADHPQGQTFDVMDGASNVTSVAGKTGAVTLDAGDIEFDDTETYASGSVGAELSDQKNAIDQKADKTTYVTLSGTIVTQTGADNTMYLCGELAELTFNTPAQGQTAIRFRSGTTPTVASFPNVTEWMGGFDPDIIEASKLYEINVLYGVGVAQWT